MGATCHANAAHRRCGLLGAYDVLTGQGGTVADAVRQIGVTEYTYYRWRKEYGGLQTNQVKRIKDLEQENARLRKAVSDLTLDKLILQEASKGNY
jgi:transposase-like protein